MHNALHRRDAAQAGCPRWRVRERHVQIYTPVELQFEYLSVECLDKMRVRGLQRHRTGRGAAADANEKGKRSSDEEQRRKCRRRNEAAAAGRRGGRSVQQRMRVECDDGMLLRAIDHNEKRRRCGR